MRKKPTYAELERRIAELEARTPPNHRTAYLASFPERNPNPIVEVDLSGRVRYANPAARGLLAAIETTRGTHPWLADWAAAVEPFVRGETQGVVREVEYEGRAFEQAMHYLQAERLVRIYGHDITSRKEAEQARLLSEETFAKAFSGSPAALSISQLADGALVDVNQAWQDLTGYGREEVAGRSMRSLGLWPAGGGGASVAEELRTKGSFRGREQRIIGKSAKAVTVLASAQIVALAGEDVVLSTWLDISERKKAEDASRTALGRLDAVLSILYSGILLVGSDGRIEFANQAFCTLFGLVQSPADLAGRTSAEIIAVIKDAYADPEGQGRRIQEIVDQRLPVRSEEVAMTGGRTFARDFFPVSADGSSRLWHHLDVTDVKRAEKALRESQALLRALTDNSPDAIYVKTPDSRWLLANPAVLRIVGKTVDEALGRTDRELYADPQTGRAIVENDRRLLEGGEPRTFEETVDTAEGRRVFLSTKAPWREVSGQIIGLIGISHDVTELKAAEQGLRENEARFRSVLDNSRDVVYRVNLLTSRFEYISPSARTVVGYTAQEWAALDAKAALDMVHPDDRSALRSAIQRLEHTGSEEVEYRQRTCSGDYRWLSNRMSLTRDATGRPLYRDGSIRDVTNQKKAEEALRQLNADLERRVADRTADVARAAEKVQAERQRFLEVLETLPVMITLIRTDHHVPFANRAYREALGQAEGRRCYEYQFGFDAPCKECQAFVPLRTGAPHHWEWTIPSGRTFDIYDFPFVDADNTPMILEMDIDITERRQAEQKLQAAHEQLSHRASQLRALASELTLSEQRERRRIAKLLHDHLQQLLVGAKYRAAILGRIDEELVRRNVVAEIEHLLDDCIQASRSLTAELSPPILHEGGLVPGLQWLGRWMGDKYGLIVELALEPDMPQLAEDVKVLLFESVRELLFNAVKHAHAGSARVCARAIEDGRLRITVSDNGSGFAPAALKRAGEAGGGFGLFGIRERLDMIGGRMEVESAPGEGSQFMLTVPMAGPTTPPVAAAPAAETSRRRAPQAGAPSGRAGIRVLLADDHVVMREGLARLLGQEPDIEIVGQAGDGEQAIALAAALLPDVILMDMSMPRLNGVEATRIIRNDNPDIRIIGLSMFEESDRAQALRDAGAAAYLTKSGPPGELIAAIRACVAARTSPPILGGGG